MNKAHTHVGTMKISAARLGALAIAAAVALATGCAGSGSAVVDQAISPREQAEPVLLSAQTSARAGKRTDAIELYKKSLAIDESNAAAWYNLGLLLQQDQQFAAAAESFQRAAELDTRDPRPYFAFASQLQQLGWLDEAEKYYALALDRQPSHLPSLMQAVQVGQLLDKYDDKMLDRSRRALQLTTDPKWREYLQRMQLMAQERVSRGGGSVAPRMTPTR
jgi:tetratricopeptide (TPR) repeat protein